MFNFLEETLLREYFLHSAVLGEFTPNRQLFDRLTKTFDISGDRANALYDMTEQVAVKEIATVSDANRYKRATQYLRENNRPRLYDEQTDALIIIKSEALAAANKEEMCSDLKTTQNNVYQVLSDRANSGCIDALRVLGTLELYGLFVEMNVEQGIENLLKASQWGDVVSMFFLIREGVNVDYVHRNFYAATLNTPYGVLADVVGNDSDFGYQGNAEITLLNKMVSAKLVNKNVYSPAHARVLYATGISREDKEKILLSENKQILSEVVNLPIYSPEGELHCQVEALERMPLTREDEQQQIAAALKNRDLRTWSNYKPLCISCDSLYLQKLHARALENCFQGEMVERIYVSELTERDFEPTANNVFVRRCKSVSDNEKIVKRNNDTGNVFLLFLNGDLSDTVMRHVKEFLVTAWRHKVQLLHPSITLDFSYAMPICICDSANAKKLKNFVETVVISAVTPDEQCKLIDEMIDKKAMLYFGRTVEITDNATKLMSDLSLEDAEKVIDSAFRAMRVKYVNATKIAFAIQPFVDTYKQQKGDRSYGFGRV